MQLLLVYMAVVIGSAALFVGASLIKGNPEFVGSVMRTPAGRLVTLAQDTESDSWMPLLQTRKNLESHPDASLYALFTEGRWKFQYPPISLAIAQAVPDTMAQDAIRNWHNSDLMVFNNWLDRTAIAFTLMFSGFIAIAARRQFSEAPPSRMCDLAIMAAIVLLGITFMPILLGYFLGQFQLVCNALLALALLLFMRGQKFSAGIAVGVFCLIKPQLSLVGLWAILRREYGLAAGIAGVGIAGLVASVVLFGPQSLIDYLGVLRLLSERGEIFYFNQSLAGVLQRFISPDQATLLVSMGSPLPAYNPVVYVASTAHSVLLIGLALVLARSAQGGRARIVDFCTIVTVATVASPVAWNHHFGLLFPVLVLLMLLLPSLAGSEREQRVLILCWVAIGAAAIMPHGIYGSRWSSLLGDQVFVGGQLLIALLIVTAVQLRREESRILAIAETPVQARPNRL